MPELKLNVIGAASTARVILGDGAKFGRVTSAVPPPMFLVEPYIVGQTGAGPDLSGAAVASALILRPQDMLVMTAELRTNAAQENFLILNLAPQQRNEIGPTVSGSPDTLLVFLVPTSVQLPTLIDGMDPAPLLNWSRFRLCVDLASGSRGTALGLADGYLFSPTMGLTWLHTVYPEATPDKPNRYALWHTRPNARANLRCVGDTGEVSMRNRDISADFALSAWGGWLDATLVSRPTIAGLPTLGLQAWSRKMVLGRDSHRAQQTTGLLLPFGHRVVMNSDVQRQVELQAQASGGAAPVARLAGSTYIAFLDQTVTYANPTINWPFTSATLKARNFVVDGEVQPKGIIREPSGEPIVIVVDLVDMSGAKTEVTVPLCVVASLDDAQLHVGDVNTLSLGGALVTYTPGAFGAHETISLSQLTIVAVADTSHAPLLPAYQKAVLRLPAMDAFTALANKDAAPNVSTEHLVTLKAVAGAFATLDSPPATPVSFAATTDRSGGLAGPSLQPRALSDASGILLTNFLEQTTVFGAVSLKDLLADDVDPTIIIPTFAAVVTVAGKQSHLHFAIPVEKTSAWTAAAGEAGPKLLGFQLPAGAEAIALDISVGAVSSGPAFTAQARLNGLVVQLPADQPLVRVIFDWVQFSMVSGGKPAITASFSALEFYNELAFVEALWSIIPLGGFSNPPFVDVTASGADVGYALAVPTLGLGGLTISNLALDAHMVIPFGGDPVAFGFDFGSLERPFGVAVSLLHGAGHFGFELTAKGLSRLDASLEFGGDFEISLVVASGGVSLNVGLHFVYTADPSDFQLAAYAHAFGYVEVLDLVSVSIDLMIILTYDFGTNVISGDGLVSATVGIAFFHKTVHFTVHKSFSGGAAGQTERMERLAPRPIGAAVGLSSKDDGPTLLGQPRTTFEDWMSAADYATYSAAFA